MVVIEYPEKSQQEDRSSWRHRGQPAKRPGPPAGATLAGHKTVLLVENESMMRGVVARVFRQLGCRVLAVPSAMDAQRLAKSNQKIDLLFMDLSTPETSELGLALWSCALYPERQVLVTCGTLWDLNYPLTELQQITILPKPFTAAELVRIVQQVLE